MRALAEHHGVYRDLFNDAYFIPVVDMKVLYDYDDEFVTPVHLGNSILPSEVGMRKTSCDCWIGSDLMSELVRLYCIVLALPRVNVTSPRYDMTSSPEMK